MGWNQKVERDEGNNINEQIFGFLTFHAYKNSFLLIAIPFLADKNSFFADKNSFVVEKNPL